MNARYLIVTYENYGDYEEHLIPLKVCEKYTLEETDGCAVFEIKKNGTIGSCVKEYEDYSDEGFVLCDYMPASEEDGDVSFSDVKVIEKVKCKTREEFRKTKQFKEWKKYFKDVNNYEKEICNSGSFAEDFDSDNEHWYVITEYHGTRICAPY